MKQAKEIRIHFCQETKLVRIVLDNIGPEYKHCVTRIVDLVKVTKMMTNAGGIVDYGNIPDAYDRSFIVDYGNIPDTLPWWLTYRRFGCFFARRIYRGG